VRGRILVVGYAPDGDSVRFVPDRLTTLRGLENGERLEPNEDDGSVQLRLDAIDAPEKDFQGEAQPLALPARDALLTRIGFTDVGFSEGETVESATPTELPAAIASSLVEVNGRPVALLYTGADAERFADRADVEVDDALVDVSVNAEQTRNGLAYITVYSTTPENVRARFVALGRAARDAGGPVWAADRSGGFTLRTHADVGPEGALVLPKLFRRATDFLASDSEQTFDAWLADQGEDDDPVEVDGRRTTLSDLVTQEGDEVRLTADPLALVFIE
jgi:endonuclease YncB( thermonuclease family)